MFVTKFIKFEEFHRECTVRKNTDKIFFMEGGGFRSIFATVGRVIRYQGEEGIQASGVQGFL